VKDGALGDFTFFKVFGYDPVKYYPSDLYNGISGLLNAYTDSFINSFPASNKPSYICDTFFYDSSKAGSLGYTKPRFEYLSTS
jgi:hypothetical protein